MAWALTRDTLPIDAPEPLPTHPPLVQPADGALRRPLLEPGVGVGVGVGQADGKSWRDRVAALPTQVASLSRAFVEDVLLAAPGRMTTISAYDDDSGRGASPQLPRTRSRLGASPLPSAAGAREGM